MPARLQRLIARLFAPASKPSAGTGGLASGPTDELPRRLCTINFTGERANWGCRATSWELVRLLNRHWLSETPFPLSLIPLLAHHALDLDIPACCPDRRQTQRSRKGGSLDDSGAAGNNAR